MHSFNSIHLKWLDGWGGRRGIVFVLQTNQSPHPNKIYFVIFRRHFALQQLWQLYSSIRVVNGSDVVNPCYGGNAKIILIASHTRQAEVLKGYLLGCSAGIGRRIFAYLWRRSFLWYGRVFIVIVCDFANARNPFWLLVLAPPSPAGWRLCESGAPVAAGVLNSCLAPCCAC